MIDILISTRPRQWVKNLLLLAPLFFSIKLLDLYLISMVFWAIIAFIFVSSSVYIMNDIFDIDKDSIHPEKKFRPIASGKIKKEKAIIVFIVLILVSIFLSKMISFQFMQIVGLYFIIQVLYTLLLKKMVLVDVFIIAIGFVLRIIAGGVAANVKISFWIILCTFLGSLFLAFGKRINELQVMDLEASSHRKALGEYSIDLVKHLASIAAAATIIAYALYTQDHDTILKFGTDDLNLTIPFVIYGMFRYLFLIYQKNKGGDPSDVFITDKPLQISIFLFALTVFLVLYI